MNLIWHIIKKDFSHNRLVIFWWAASGILVEFSIIDSNWGTWVTHGFLFVCLIAYYVLPLGLIASIYQEDNMLGSEGFLRTRPMSSRRLLSAKLGLVMTLFVVVPLLFLLVEKGLRLGSSWTPNLGTIGLNLTCAVLAASTAAACCKNLSRYYLALFVGFFCYYLLRLAFSYLAEAAPVELRALPHETKLSLIPIIFSGFWVGALYNIYYRRRLPVAICLIAVGVVGMALIGDFMTAPLPH